MGSLPTSPLAVMLRVIQLTVFVLTLAIFTTCQLAALQACDYLPPFRWLRQARLESDVLEPQPGVTAGFAVTPS